MDSDHRHDKLPAKVTKKTKNSRKANEVKVFPIVSIDQDSNFASIKLCPGIEAKSYLRDGILFSEDENGRVIELQILNLSMTSVSKPKKAKTVG